MVEESLLREPADRCVRLVALSLLADAQDAGDRLMRVSRELRDGDAGSDDALHDFRVAVRRLRSWIRAFEPSLRDAVSRKQRRRLSAIADATAATRDATVHLEWLHEEQAALTARQRVGLSWLRERLETQRKNGSEAALTAASDFDAMVARLTRRLKVYRSPVVAHERPARFGASLAAQLLKASDALRGDLAAIHHATDIDECHRARIAAKRLRHVIEPVSEVARDGKAIIETLKLLQDALGDLHDSHVFSKDIASQGKGTVARPGMVRLVRRLRDRGAHAYASVERIWLNDAPASFFDRVRTLAAALARRASLGTEIERKYLLDRLPDDALAAPSVEIEQGYLPGETVVERIRHVKAPDGTERWYRTVKIGSGVERLEFEEEAGADLGRVMWRLTKGRRIHKRRYSIRESDDVLWEVDEYLDRTLVVAEIELPAPDTQVTLPPWLRAIMGREVTDEPAYANALLAR